MIRSVLAAFLLFFVFVSGAPAQNCGTYPNTLTNGTNADANQVMGNFNYILPCVRDRLTAARTYYVRTDGNDACNGLTNAAGSSGACAFRTIQKSINTVAALDLSIYNVTIQLGTGTWSEAVTVNGPWVGSGTVTINGDTTTPSNCVLSNTGFFALFAVSNGAQLRLSGLQLSGTFAGGRGIYVSNDGLVIITGVMNFASLNAGVHMLALDGGHLQISSPYNITGGGSTHVALTGAGSTIRGQGVGTFTLTGAPAFTTAFISVDSAATAVLNADVYSGAATGTRYTVTNNGVISTNGGGANYFPGNVAGTTATGGQYN
jgi:hypothetical protein